MDRPSVVGFAGAGEMLLGTAVELLDNWLDEEAAFYFQLPCGETLGTLRLWLDTGFTQGSTSTGDVIATLQRAFNAGEKVTLVVLPGGDADYDMARSCAVLGIPVRDLSQALYVMEVPAIRKPQKRPDPSLPDWVSDEMMDLMCDLVAKRLKERNMTFMPGIPGQVQAPPTGAAPPPSLKPSQARMNLNLNSPSSQGILSEETPEKPEVFWYAYREADGTYRALDTPKGRPRTGEKKMKMNTEEVLHLQSLGLIRE